MDTGSRTIAGRGKPRPVVRVAVVGAILGLTTAGCSSSSAGKGHTPATPRPSASVAHSAASSSAALNFVAQVDALCGELEGKVLAVYGGQGHHTTFPISVFNAERPKLAAVTRDFDAKVDAIAVRTADRAAAKAFDALRRQSDQKYRTLVVAAATGKQANFDAAFAKLVASEGKPDPVMDAARNAGIFCNAR
jgi:hypothetical protein